MLYDLEAGMPFLFIDQLVIQTPLAASGSEAEDCGFCWRCRGNGEVRNNAPAIHASRYGAGLSIFGAARRRPRSGDALDAGICRRVRRLAAPRRSSRAGGAVTTVARRRARQDAHRSACTERQSVVGDPVDAAVGHP